MTPAEKICTQRGLLETGIERIRSKHKYSEASCNFSAVVTPVGDRAPMQVKAAFQSCCLHTACETNPQDLSCKLLTLHQHFYQHTNKWGQTAAPVAARYLTDEHDVWATGQPA